ncbi:MAG: efflux RND transporter periplasmic adaptor subunit [Fimbriimonadaceae bacterium]|nr:efflux RND transporter periplasmic adaptor subunit [Fimbriimonadaceae bacterium]
MKKGIYWIGGVAALGFLGWFFLLRGGSGNDEIEYRYEKVQRTELVRSISSTGQLVALTTVDVKSKAGGTIVRLAVDEGSKVKMGDLIAEIDPRDTKATYDQATADVETAQARADQAAISYDLQIANSQTAVKDAENALVAAKIRYDRAKLEADRQPTLTKANITSAQAAFDSAKSDYDKYINITAPQVRRDVRGTHDRAKADLAAATADLERQKELYSLGYVAKAVVERSQSTYEGAKSTFSVAEQRLLTLDKEIEAETTRLKLARDRAGASLDEAKANGSQTAIALKSLQDAQTAVRTAEINIQKAKDALANNKLRASELSAAKAGTVRSRVQLENTKVQLDSTTVLAPRDGVVTLKYLEEGTIIPPGTSTFAQGTSIVQISDVTRLFVECAVDEADISAVKVGQRVRILTEAFPGVALDGEVVRVNPAALTAQNITAIKVRVEIKPGYKIEIMPGMNATCEFITLSKPDILRIPGQALIREDGKTFVRVKGTDPLKPERREVKVGDTGNDGVEILEGLKEGEEVVVAEINLRELREIQERMVEAQQGGGLAGGGSRPGGNRTRTSAATAGGTGGSGGGGNR